MVALLQKINCERIVVQCLWRKLYRFGQVVLGEIRNTLAQNPALLETVQPWTTNLLNLIPNTNEFCDGIKSESAEKKV